ncbi:phage tail family protein [Arthrobacter sp. zg-Y20]|uniref:phage tail family protein n=1 Tax=unclassified Arthrobacter TaxID=235627 RepID=UPI001D143B55|nr:MULTISPECIES: phage tail family protein [unclassified Arthrobacter]MCC3276369.1 phage tail family protein [Arthrobacter sp. zg-Y20]MDK1316528.1 phage tail family protein [Arthrobacter sp. zg.Y20]WIB06569.1 phage tail family protein [Arthrobacter sp. zg-Y20]
MQVADGVGVSLAGLDLQSRQRLGYGYKVTDLTGWWEPTASSGALERRGQASGGVLSEANAEGRRLVAKGTLLGRTADEAADLLEDLVDHIPLQFPQPFVVTERGVPKFVPLRQEDRPVIKWVTDTLVTFDLQFHSREYLKREGAGLGYSRSDTVGLPYTSGGRRRPYQLPSAIQATVLSGAVAITSPNRHPVGAEVTFIGPGSSPIVRKAATGESLRFDGPLLPGQRLVLDLDHHTARLDGVPRDGAVEGEWFNLTAGDVLLFDAAAYDPDTRMTASWSPSWK